MTDIVDVVTGDSIIFGLKSDGTVVACGWDCAGLSDVNDWENIKVNK